MERNHSKKEIGLQGIEPFRNQYGDGTGSITELLAEAGHHVTYVDSSPEMTKLTKQKCQRCGDRIAYLTCSVESLDKLILDSSFDVVFGRHILWATENLLSSLQVAGAP